MKYKILGYTYTVKNNSVVFIQKTKQKIKNKTKKNYYNTFEHLIIECLNKDYNFFLKSKYWKKLKKIILKRDGFKCKLCGSVKYLEIHHKTYKHHFLEHKYKEELITLCKECHTLQHK